jgi:hypothetical protein
MNSAHSRLEWAPAAVLGRKGKSAAAVASTGTTTTLVSVCNPVTVTAGRSVVVNGTVSKIVIDRTLKCPVLFNMEVSGGRAVTVTVLASRVSVVTGTVIVTVLVKGAAAEEDALSAGTDTVVVERTAVPERKAEERVDAKVTEVGCPSAVTVMVLMEPEPEVL